MTSTFTFGFSGDDIESDVDEQNEIENTAAAGLSNLSLNKDSSASDSLPTKVVEAERFEFRDWISTLPSQISYNTLNLNVSTQPGSTPTTLRLARREVFDIRAQLMAEDGADADADHEELIAGLREGDLKPYFYEGGFKTWECALDLARLVASEGGVDGLAAAADDDDEEEEEEEEDVHVIELGCGTAMPSLAIFAQLLARRPALTSPRRRKFYFTLADYNATVLRLVTLPNLLLTWKLNTCPATATLSSMTTEEKGAGQPQPQTHADQEDGDLDVDPALLDAFQNDLAARGIEIDFVAGGWSARFVELAMTARERKKQQQQQQCSSQTQTQSSSQNKNITSQNQNIGPSAGNSTCTCMKMKTLLLASETIYSPASLTVFSETVLELLRRCSRGPACDTVSVSISGNDDNTKSQRMSKSKALIAAKKVYFGVGGGIDEFLHVLYRRKKADEIVDTKQRVEVKTEGVGRVILEIGLEKASS